jgi:hypothetical protein
MSDLMNKIGALLMKAEGTDNEHEKNAYLSKAQSLATLASIDLEVARQRQVVKTERETPIKKHISLFDRYDKSRNKSAFVFLMLGIGEVNDLAFDIAHDSTYVIAYGYPSDIAVTEALYAMLSAQMVRDAENYLKTGEHRKETVKVWSDKYWDTISKPLDGRVARRSFYDGFRTTVKNRLYTARKESIQEYQTVNETTGTDLVLVNKAEVVREFRKENTNARGSYRGSSSGGRNGGYSAGQAAGARANIGGNAGIGGKRAIG